MTDSEGAPEPERSRPGPGAGPSPAWQDAHQAYRRRTMTPHAPLDERTRQGAELPRTLLPAPDGADQPLIFEPALRQFRNAYRAGEPRFPEAESGRAWRQARRTALDLVLSSIASGPWAGHLVLRGGALMSTWFGEAAREPGDLDFVVTPRDWDLGSPRTERMFETLVRDAAAACADSPVTLVADGARTEDIWTYDRVPGRRLLLPWTAPGTPGGSVQLDLVFNEPLAAPPLRTALRPLGEGPASTLWAASPALSLAWKLMWLVSDRFVQGKDLYDAVLLAERVPREDVTYTLLRDAFVALGGDGLLRPCGHWWIDGLSGLVEWEDLVAEYPSVTGSDQEYLNRLREALRPVFDEADGYGSSHDGWALWLAPVIDELSAEPPHRLPATLHRRLADSGWDGLVAAVVVLREIRGSTALTDERALNELLDDEHWSRFAEHQGRTELLRRIRQTLTQ